VSGRPPAAPGITLRPAAAADAGDVADVYLASFHATYDFPLAHTDEEVHWWMRDVVAAGGTWVAVEPGARSSE
jgi:hypothetical protein